PRYASTIMYYKLTLANNRLTATRINKSDVSPYAHITYVDKYVNNLLENGYPNRNKIVDFIASYDMVNSISATRSIANMLVNGERVAVTGYTVNDSNYFKVRDIAMLLRNTPSKFNVSWDGNLNAIMIDTHSDYIAIGGELSSEIEQDMNVVENNTPIYVDGRRTAITAYNINGSSYFKIRDIADAAGFEIQWDGASQTINIITY
ncbi:MAG: stalk domain-containing protein, partial [Clostridia bacterium]|nr:stalk domain-containing protein [Clostridia bacterium]